MFERGIVQCSYSLWLPGSHLEAFVVVIFQYDSGLSAGKSSFGFKLGMLTVLGNNLFQCAKCFEIKLNNKNTRVLCKLLTMKPNSQDDT